MSNEKRTKFNLNPRIKSVKRGKSSKHILAEVGQLIAIQSTLNKTVIQKGGKDSLKSRLVRELRPSKAPFSISFTSHSRMLLWSQEKKKIIISSNEEIRMK